MGILLFIGRLAFVLIFIFSGASKLMDIGGTASMIAGKVMIPEQLSGIANQLQTATGLTVPQFLAVVTGVVELGGGLMIAVNIGTRFAALALIIFTTATTFYFHDFWNMTGGDRANNMIHALKNLSIVGAMLVFFVIGSARTADYQEAGTPAPRY